MCLKLPIPYIKKLLGDISPIIRQAGLRHIKLESIKFFKKEISILTYDRSRRVRESARYLVGAQGIDNLYDSYCNLLTKFEVPPLGLIAGFMEVAEKQDLDRLKSYLDHSSSLVRSSALVNIHRLKDIEVPEIATKCLLDESSVVRKVAVHILKHSSSSIDKQIRLYFSTGPLYAKRTCLSVLISRRSFYALKIF